MTLGEKKKLIEQAVRLTTLGYEVEGARNKLRKLVENKFSYESPQIKKAVKEF